MLYTCILILFITWLVAQPNCWSATQSELSPATVAMSTKTEFTSLPSFAIPADLGFQSDICIPTAKETIQRLCQFERSKIRELKKIVSCLLRTTERLPIKVEVQSFTLSEIAIVMADVEKKGYLAHLNYDDTGRCTDMSIAVESEDQNEWHEVSAKVVSR